MRGLQSSRPALQPGNAVAGVGEGVQAAEEEVEGDSPICPGRDNTK